MKLVKSLHPSKVLDVGANNGFHSSMLAHHGIPALAIDSDEHAINSCYRFTRDKPELPICASVDKFLECKHEADVVMSLALTHHLSLSQKLTFDQIAKRYSEMARRHLVVEFMPNGMGSTVPKPDPLPGFYSLDAFMQAFRSHFREVRLVDYERPADKSVRKLVLCSKT